MDASHFSFRNEKLKQAIDKAELHPEKYSAFELAEEAGLTYDAIKAGFRRAGKQRFLRNAQQKKKVHTPSTRKEYIPPPPDTTNVLVVGDVHLPFAHKDYLAFCKAVYKEWKCTHIIFTGDFFDMYSFSNYDHDPDAMNGGEEIEAIQAQAQEWVKAFPRADVLIGNHDHRVMRKAFGAGLPRALLRSFEDLIDAPTWHFREKFIYDGVRYIHGEGGSARNRARKDWISTVQGHLHPEAYVDHIQGENSRIFAMQIGCGVDMNTYAFDYAKHHRRPVIGVGLVLDHGRLPINLIMPS